MTESGQSRRRFENRNAIIEFAFVFGLLWLLLTGCFSLGYLIYRYETLVSSLAAAGRYAARVTFDEPAHTFLASVQNMAVYGSPAAGGAAVAPGLTTSNIRVTWTVDPKGVPLTITLQVVNYTVHAIFRSITWSGKPSVTVRFSGLYTS